MLYQRAFTLIELLIVVAIIAILAAIAVPNFLEAQTRAKVSRVKTDMRTLMTATESYRVDNNQYAVPSDVIGIQGTIPYPDGSGAMPYFECKTPALITTPIAYLSSRPLDVFLEFEGVDEKGSKILYHYATRNYAEVAPALPAPEDFDSYCTTMLAQATSCQYYFLSHGPDNFHNGPDETTKLPCYYDPTNGSISGGDVVRFGPGQNVR
ncbi:MAG: type II secretion system protein [Candidatus Sumerlaeaceae bacterium]